MLLRKRLRKRLGGSADGADARGETRPGNYLVALLATSASGLIEVERGPRWTDRMVARFCGHRRSGLVPASITAGLASPARVVLERRIGGRRCITMVSVAGTEVRERRGPLELRLSWRSSTAGGTGAGPVELDGTGAGLRLGPLAMAVPSRLAPSIRCRIHRRGPWLELDVDIRDSRGRLMLHYRGELAVCAPPQQPSLPGGLLLDDGGQLAVSGAPGPGSLPGRAGP